MLYSHHNFNEEFSNANGRGNNLRRRKLALTELSKLIVEDREAVIEVLNKCGINVEKDATPHQIKRAIIQNANPKSKRFKLLLHRISKLILTKNDKSLSSSFSNLVSEPTNLGDKTAKKEKSGWFKENAGALGNLAGGLLGGIISGKGQQQLDQQVNAQTRPNVTQAGSYTYEEPKSNTGKIILFGALGLGVIGLTIFLIKRANEKK